MKCKCEESSAFCGEHFPECPFKAEPIEPKVVMHGWLCPACGGGVSPYVTKCPCVPTQNINWPNFFPVVGHGAGGVFSTDNNLTVSG